MVSKHAQIVLLTASTVSASPFVIAQKEATPTRRNYCNRQSPLRESTRCCRFGGVG